MLSIWQFCSWTFSHENESISVKLTYLIVGVLEKSSVEYTFPHLLPFNLLSKSLISSDLQWLAKLVLVVQLWSLHKISDQKKMCRRQMVNCWRCVASWLSHSSQDIKVSGFRPWMGTLCCVLAYDTTLSVPLYTQVYKWVLANLMLGVTLRWACIPPRGSRNTHSLFIPQKPG